jgi:hypothetical protein
MNPWLRPSIQIPRKIAQGVKALFTPITYPLGIVKDYWDTWHKVYKPDSEKNVDKK